MTKSKIFVLLIITLLTILFSCVNFQKRYAFDWDQEDDAYKVASIIELKKPLLIGPRVAGADSFFTGPYHYYFLLLFYLATSGDPIAGFYAVVLVNILTTLTVFIVTDRLFGFKTAIIA